MYCIKCGTNYEGNFCPNCGSSNTPIQPQNPQQQNMPNYFTQQPAQKSKQKKQGEKKGKHTVLIIVIIILILLLLVGGTIGFFAFKKYFDPSNKVLNALSVGNYDEAVELFEDLEEPSDNLIAGIEERLDSIYINYKNSSIDYDAAKLELDTIEKMGIDDISYKFTDIYSKVDALNKSRTAFETAEAFKENNDYVNAITQYKLVIEEDSNYETAKKGISASMTAYKQYALQNASKAIGSNDYASALSILNEALNVLANDSEITKQITVYSATYETETLKKAEKLLKAKKFDKAEALLNDALKILPDNNKLTEKLNSIDSMRPVELNSLVVIDSSEYEYKNELFTDSYGNHYNSWYNFSPIADYNAFAIYNLNKQYTNVDLSVVASPSLHSNRIIHVSIYLDDKLVYSLDDFRKTSAKKDISLDVTNITKLEIMVGHNGRAGEGSTIGIVNATLSK